MKVNKKQRNRFQNKLLDWHYRINERSYPWTNEKDPYKIWLSEIMLQQTQVQQGLPYYLSFVKAYPRIQDLAAAQDEEVFRRWEGLGYYNRCRNMLATARWITEALDGRFPNTYESILALKGVGPYTAAAISSFAFGLPYAVLDGNVFRVLSRVFAIETPIDTTKGRKEFQQLAQDLLAPEEPGSFNQALMDLGSVICTPSKPDCESCPLAELCHSKGTELLGYLPRKEKKLKVQKRYFNYFLLSCEGEYFIRQRQAKDVWRNLFEFYLIEGNSWQKNEAWHQLKSYAKQEPKLVNTKVQRLSHQVIKSQYWQVPLKIKPPFLRSKGHWVGVNQFKTYPFPRSLRLVIEEGIA